VDGQFVMPEGLLDTLTDDQVVDLVRFRWGKTLGCSLSSPV